MHRMFVSALAAILLALSCTGCGQSDNAPAFSQRPVEDQPAQSSENAGANPLSDRELLYFNEEFFNQGEGTVSCNPFLSSFYKKPEEIDLFALFHYGCHSSEDMDEAERKAVANTGDFLYDPEASLVKCTTAEMDAVLTQYMGMPLADTNGVGLDRFTHLPDYDAYYLFHDGPRPVPSVTFLSGERTGDLVQLYYDASEFFADTVMELDVSDDHFSACVTLQQTENGYRFVSNELVPIPVYHLEVSPESIIPLTELAPYSCAQMRIERHANDCSYCIGKHQLDSSTVCAYISTDGHTYVALLYDETEWETGVFLTLPDGAYDLGFAFGKVPDLFGRSGVKISYEQQGKSISQYYCLAGDGSPVLLAKGNGTTAIADLDRNGEDELIVYNDGCPYLIFQRNDDLYRADIDALFKEYWTGMEYVSFQTPDIQNRRFPLCGEVTAEDGSMQQTESGILYFYKEKLLLYMEPAA